MRTLVITFAVLLGACATDAQEPEPTVETGGTQMPDMDIDTPRGASMNNDTLDVCGIAATLPEGDICRNICDPAAMADQLVAEGAATGNCYQFYCQLTETEHVLAGVCLAP